MRTPKRCQAPARFRPAGKVTRAILSPIAPPLIEKRRRGRRADGIRYERQGQQFLLSHFPDRYVPSPWYRYWTEKGGPYWCQPDGLLFDIRNSTLTIIEFKLRHTTRAWWQIRRLYEPVLRVWLGSGWTFAAVEVVRWFDPDLPFPERVVLVPHVDGARPSKFGVHIWNGKDVRRRARTRRH